MNARQFFVLFFAALFTASLSLGCYGPQRDIVTYRVSGTVTFDGKPVENVQVSFVPVVEGIGEPAGAYTDAKGAYRLSSMNSDPGAGAMLGEYRVLLSHKIQRPGVEPKRDASGNVLQYDLVEAFPKDCQDPEKTPWTATVVKGRNRFDFPVVSSAPTR